MPITPQHSISNMMLRKNALCFPEFCLDVPTTDHSWRVTAVANNSVCQSLKALIWSLLAHHILILFIHSTHKQSWRRGVNKRGHKPSGFLCSDCGLPRKVLDSRGLFQKRERICQLFGRCQAIKV